MDERSLTPPPSPGPLSAPTKDERSMAMLCHLLAIVSSWVGPLIIWLIKKDQSAFLNDQGKEALNFQITFFIAYVVSALLMFAVIGCVLLPIVLVCNIVFCIMGAVAANKGVAYRYPFNIRIIR